MHFRNLTATLPSVLGDSSGFLSISTCFRVAATTVTTRTSRGNEIGKYERLRGGAAKFQRRHGREAQCTGCALGAQIISLNASPFRGPPPSAAQQSAAAIIATSFIPSQWPAPDESHVAAAAAAARED